MEMEVSNFILLMFLKIINLDPYGKKTTFGSNKPKTQIKNKVTAQERMEAEAALRSLKQKIANAPKKPIKQTQPKPSGFNQNKISLNNHMNYNMDFDMDYSNNNKYNNSNNQTYKKPKTTVNTKKQMPLGGNLRSGPKMNNNKFGGGFGGNFGGGFGGGGFEDNRPLGGGLTADQMQDTNMAVKPCPHCGRNFNEISYPKHIKNCEKVFQKKRKAFNTQKQRFVDSEQASLMKMGAMQAKKNPKLNKPKGGIPKWKLQSMEFRAICNPGKANKIRKEMGFGNNMMNNNKMGMGMGNNINMKGGKNVSKSVKTGGYGGMGGGMGMDMGGYFPSATPLDYTHCQYCNRNYNEEAYNKHLNGCKRRYEEAQMRNKLSKKPLAKTQIKNSYGKGQINYPMYGANAKKFGKKK